MEFLEAIKEFIKPELLILIPVLNGVGYIIKHMTEAENKYIPLALFLAGALATIVYGGFALEEGFNAKCVTINAVQGMLIGLSAVGTNQLIKQSKEK